MKYIYAVPLVGDKIARFVYWVHVNSVWMVTAGKWICAEKIVTGLFVYVILGRLIEVFGKVNGSCAYLVLVTLCSIIFLHWYDLQHKDFFGIETMKSKFHGRFAWSRQGPAFVRILFLCISFVLAIWQLAPPLVVLCFRKEHVKPKPWLEYPAVAVYAVCSLFVWVPIELYVIGPIRRLVFG